MHCGVLGRPVPFMALIYSLRAWELEDGWTKRSSRQTAADLKIVP